MCVCFTARRQSLFSFHHTMRAGPQIIKKDFARHLPEEYSCVSRNKKSLFRRISCGAEFIALQNMRSGEQSCKAVGMSQRPCMQPARPSSRAGQSNRLIFHKICVRRFWCVCVSPSVCYSFSTFLWLLPGAIDTSSSRSSTIS